ncbi:uncharacterized protein EV420DRAFT_1494866 [Desarmillaria tabescens]|uniref:Uncharacterized protein n=1 Tax=Armillaria tabescens TaxID=1929756 RepID=A0AA39NPL2_ARMTA|nr:uncharacterized protein EV420DRAFT_1494866 [Desarmillaria tabescens]KAK0469507.1 hypothetical protein EV420DRAFT_1494866 [Desarmillaria tabescens]
MVWISKTSKEDGILALALPNVGVTLLVFLRLTCNPYLCPAKTEELELVSLFFRPVFAICICDGTFLYSVV